MFSKHSRNTKRINYSILMAITISSMLFVLAIGPTTAQDEAPITVTDAFGNEVVIEDMSRIVTLGGAVTETVFALNMGENIVAVDESSIYPAEATELPIIGYLRFLTAEPILEVAPTLIIATEDAGPAEVVDQLKSSGVTFLVVPAEDTFEGAAEKIMAIATALGREEEGVALVAEMEADVTQAAALSETVETKPRVMFIFLRGAAVLIVSGEGTGADEMIRLAGGENVITDYEGYMPISAEAVIAAAPDIILTTSLGIESVGGLDALMELPGIAQTPAGENGRIIYQNLDDLYLLGFTSRMGDAVLDLTYLLHEELPRPIPVVLRLDGRFNIFMNGIETAGHDVLLSGEGTFTIFAPTDQAFLTMDPETLESLLSSPISVHFVWSHHYVSDRLLAADILAMDGQALTANYGELPVSLGEDGTIILEGAANMIESDIEAANGIIHAIDMPMVPERR